MPKVASTVSPVSNGTTANIAQCPPIAFAAARSMGSPGEYVGTIDQSSGSAAGR